MPVLVIVAGLFTPAVVLAENKPLLRYVVDTGTDSWTPYMTPGSAPEKPGILVELTRLILDRAGIEGEEVPLPERRNATAFKDDKVDFEWASPAWFPGGAFPETDVASDHVLSTREVLVFPKGQSQRWLLPYMIYGHSVGTIDGYTYHDSNKFTRFNVRNEKTLVELIDKNRIKVGIIGELPGRYWARVLEAEVEFGPVHSEGALVMRLQGRHKGLLNRINDAIHSLRQEGRVNEIVGRYIDDLQLH